MGVKDPALRQRLEAALPGSGGATVGGAAGMQQEPVTPLNAAARRIKAQGTPLDATVPALIVCADTSGGLGGLEGVLAALTLPAFSLCLPTNADVLSGSPEASDVGELASLGAKALREAGVVAPAARLLLAGVGFGAVLAHELAVQLSAATSASVQALVLLEGSHSLATPSATLSWLSPAARTDAAAIAAALYPAVVAAAGHRAPGLEAFATRLASLDGYEAQLDYVATFRPAEEAPVDWDRHVTTLLARLAHWQALASTYAPPELFSGQTLLFAHRSGVAAAGQKQAAEEAALDLLARGGPGGAWAPIAWLVQPLAAAHLLAPAAGASPTSIARQLQAALLEAVRLKDVADAAAERSGAIAAGGGAASVGSIALPMALLSPCAGGGATPMWLADLPQGSPVASPTALGSVWIGAPAHAVAAVLPLNRLCPERTCILRGRGSVPVLPARALASPAAPTLTRLPLWILHDETGRVGSALCALAASLPLPAYALAMGSNAASCASLYDLASHYAAAICGVQPSGPYLLLGPSLAGGVLARAVASSLRAGGARVALLLLDGAAGLPAAPLHDFTWYALFQLLREIGTLSGSMGEFVDAMR